MKKIVFILIAVLVVAIYLAVELVSTRREVRQVRKELAGTESVLDVTREQEQIEAFLRTSVVFYADGKKKEAYRFLEYAIFKMADRDYRDLGMLPVKMIKDPVVAKKLRFAKLVKKGPSGKIRRFGGG